MFFQFPTPRGVKSLAVVLAPPTQGNVDLVRGNLISSLSLMKMKWCEVTGLNKRMRMIRHSPPIDDQSQILDSTDKWLFMKGWTMALEGCNRLHLSQCSAHSRKCKSIIFLREGEGVTTWASVQGEISLIAGLHTNVSVCATMYTTEKAKIGCSKFVLWHVHFSWRCSWQGRYC